MNMQRRLMLTIMVVLAVLAMASAAMAQAGAPAASGPEADKRVTLQFKDVPIGNAIAILFEGINHVVEPGVQGSVTLVLNEVPFTDALQALLKSAGLTARKENGVYYIGPRKELTQDPSALAPVVEEPEVEVERSKIPEKLLIGFADVQEIGTYLNAQIGSSARNQNGMGGGMMGGGMMGGGMMGGGMMGGGMMGGGMMGGGMMGGGNYGGGMMGGGNYGGNFGGNSGRW